MPQRFTDVESLAEMIKARAAGVDRPFTVAIDGRSASGKTTLAAALAEILDAAVIEGDDFYAGGTELRGERPVDLVRNCIDWARQREALEALRAGQDASWQAFDWDAFDGRLCEDVTVKGPKPIIILEGVYASRPELEDLLDIKLLLNTDEAVRESRLVSREGAITPWKRQWESAEEYYFEFIRPPTSFDAFVNLE